MSLAWFPLEPHALAATQALLGTTLPPRYVAALTDPRVQRVLSHPSVSSFRPGISMAAFAGFTAALHARHPTLPSGAVVAAAVLDPDTHEPQFHRGYWRLWLPDGKTPGQLGPVVYAWDAARGRKTRDCTVDAWLTTVMRVVASSDPAFFPQVGLPLPRAERPPAPVFSVRALEGPLGPLLHGRGAETHQAVQRQAGAWLGAGTWTLQGPTVCVGDGAASPLTAGLLRVPLPAGAFGLEVRVAWWAAAQRAVVSSVRMRRLDAVVAEARTVGHVDVDHAVLALGDPAAFTRAVRSTRRAQADDELMALPVEPVWLMAREMPVQVRLPSGRGDGTYPVRTLHDATGELIGVDVVLDGADDAVAAG